MTANPPRRRETATNTQPSRTERSAPDTGSSSSSGRNRRPSNNRRNNNTNLNIDVSTQDCPSGTAPRVAQTQAEASFLGININMTTTRFSCERSASINLRNAGA